MAPRTRHTLNRWLAVGVSVIAVVTGAYGFHCWGTTVLANFVDKRVECQVRLIQISVNLLLTEQQRNEALEQYKREIEERELKKR